MVRQVKSNSPLTTITSSGRRPPSKIAPFLDFLDHSTLHHDLGAVGQEFTRRGEMVRKLVDRKQEDGQEQAVGRAIQLALDAFES